MTSTIDIARQLLQAQYAIAPLKKPLALAADGKKEPTFLPEWREISTTNADILHALDQNPRLGYLVDCGKSEIVVVDLDIHNHPDAAQAWIDAGGVESTMTVTTQAGGRHLFFRASPEVALGTMAGNTRHGIPGIDIRGIGGCIFGPGTVVQNGGGTYRLDGPVIAARDLPPAPVEAILAVGGKVLGLTRPKDPNAPQPDPSLLNPDETQRFTDWMHESVDAIRQSEDGQRHYTILREASNAFRLAAWIGQEWDSLEAAMVEAYHQSGGTDARDLYQCLLDARQYAEDSPKEYHPAATPRGNVMEVLDAEATLEQLLALTVSYKAPWLPGNPRETHAMAAPAIVNRLHGKYLYAKGVGWMQWAGDRWTAECKIPVSFAVSEISRTECSLPHRILSSVQDNGALAAAKTELVQLKKSRAGKGSSSEITPHEAELQSTVDSIDEWTSGWSKVAGWWSALSDGYHRGRVMDFVKETPGIFVTLDQLDSQPWLLNCKNGTVDLRTGELRKHDPMELITKSTGINFRMDARHDLWDLARQSFAPGIEPWLQTRIGAGAFGRPDTEENMLVCAGKGFNGKSTLSDALLSALGDYAIFLHDKALLGNERDHGAEQMVFRGARWAILEELPEGQGLRPALIKKLVGTSRITARKMYQDPVTFDATHSVIINTNHLPQVSESDWGTWRRLLNIPWPFTYRRPGQPIRNAFDKPVNEKVKWGIQRDDEVKEAALRWIVGGAVRYTRNGDKTEPMPQPIAAATDFWRASSDVLGQFVADNCIVERGHIIRTTEFLELFNEYLRELGKKEVSHNYVTSRLADLDESIEAKQVKLGDKTNLSQRNAASPTEKVRGYLGLRWAERRDKI